jgi:hypothetical protein
MREEYKNADRFFEIDAIFIPDRLRSQSWNDKALSLLDLVNDPLLHVINCSGPIVYNRRFLIFVALRHERNQRIPLEFPELSREATTCDINFSHFRNPLEFGGELSVVSSHILTVATPISKEV